jgi:uncharacterized membrane protein YqjE
MDNTPHAEGGILSTLTRMLKTLRDAAESRLELFVAEWREERLRLLDILVLLLIGALCGFMALLLVTFAVIVIFWSTHPVLVVGLLILFYALMAAVAFAVLRLEIRRLGVFTATLEQIRKDLACFKEKS